MSTRHGSRNVAIAATLFTALAIFSTILMGFGAERSDAASPKCTIKGTNGPDRLIGTGKRDVICGFGGSDVLVGKSGRDVLIGGSGNDRFRGDAGSDRVEGGPGADRLRGGSGGDHLVGGAGNDRLLGEPQNDTLLGGPGNDFLDGGAGHNRIDGGPGQNRCLAGAADTLAGTCDNTAPELVSLSLSTASIDTWEQDRYIDVSMRVTDDISGIRDPSISIYHPATGQKVWPGLERVDGDDNDATYEGRIRVPRYSAQGHWVIDASAVDKAGNSAYIDAGQLAARGLPNGFEQTGLGDNEKPKIVELSIDRSSINTFGADQTVNVRMRVTDDMTGVTLDQFNAIGFVASKEGIGNQAMADFHRVSGTDTDGVYEGQLTMKRYAPQGVWDLRAGAVDRAGNMTLHTASELQTRGFPHSLNQTGVGDTQPPQLLEFSVSPGHIDTTNGPQTVTYRYRATDDLSGLWSEFGGLNLKVNGVPAPVQASLTRISGNALDGIYEGSAELPQGSTNGNWTTNPSISDAAGNSRYYDDAALGAAGFSIGFTNGP